MIITTIKVRSTSKEDGNTVCRRVDSALFNADTEESIEWEITEEEDA
ncbi:hypothetical protein M5X04_26920 [Paenibacillus alvei]|uniref:Uncharacterized protein n=1 Tax=Paenibacillus alvei TaxID=44250 RepID=A0ABT4EGR5_PAEAL|nr:hypothetical protein [Paenibacillus alvei]MCY9532946.1 hypothetical protein [Paenibacillus alvei]